MNQTNQNPEENPQWLTRKAKIVWSIVLGLVVLGCAMLYGMARALANAQNPRPLCRVYLKLIHVSALTWAHEHETNVIPADILLLTNDLDPKYLRCPSDKEHRAALTWADFTKSNLSYVIIPGVARDSTNVFVRCPYHHHAITAEGGIIVERTEERR
jgi:hypothetical protein